MHRLPRSLCAAALTGVALLTLAACSSGDEDARPTPSHSRSASASASTAPTRSATTAPPTQPDGDASDAPTTVPLPSQTPAAPVTEAAPSDFPATALVTYAGWDAGSQTLQASGIVSGATSESGTCTFLATNGGTTRELPSQASVAATSVNCAQVGFPRAQLGTGTWTVSLRYSIGTSSVTSTTTTVEIP